MTKVSLHHCQLCGRTPLVEFPVSHKQAFWYCRGCGLYQYGRSIDFQAPNQKGYFHSHYDRHADRKLRTASVRLSRIAALLDDRPIGLLDFGCGNGITLQAARQRGWSATGVDINPANLEVCRAKQLDVQLTDGLELPVEDNSYDVVTAWSVIEHVVDVRKVLQEFARVLRPGGIVAMDTSDALYWKARLMGARYKRFWPLGHTYTFTPSTLSRLVRQSGFAIVRHPLIGRLRGLSPKMAAYAIGYQLQYELRRSLKLQKAFQLFARLDTAAAVPKRQAA